MFKKEEIIKERIYNMKNILLIIFFIASQNLIAQEVYTEFTNPSFEDTPRPQHPPYAWWDCGFPGETPPDVHPVLNNGSIKGTGAFGVNRPAYDGKTYLGMVVRENDTWESVCQRLPRPLEAKKPYMFHLFMCKSQNYLSRLKDREEDVSFTTPILLRVWGGTGFCNKKELLAETELVNHLDWKEYTIRFFPTSKHSYISLEAYYNEDFEIPNGNIMLDNLSPIYYDNDYVPTPLENLKRFITDDDFRLSFNKKNELKGKSKDLLKVLEGKIKDIDNLHLVFAVNEKKKSKSEERIVQLNSFIKDLEIEKTKFSVKKFDGFGERLEWISLKGDVCIGLIEIE